MTKKFWILIGLVLIIAALELTAFWFALSTTSSIRAYVGGEGLWSKAQKESFNALLRYSTTFSEEDYGEFRSLLEVPLGDREARLELEKPNPDLAVAREGFLKGGNHPDDIDGMIYLFRTFRQVSYIDHAISVWAEADTLVQKKLALGEEMRARIVAGGYGTDAYNAIQPLVHEAVDLDAEFTKLETEFSATLAEGARAINNWMFYFILGLTFILGSIALAVALFILRLLRQVDAAKTEFVALTSHQLRSPLSVMTLSLDLLRRLGSRLGKEEEQIVHDLEHEVHTMGSLVDTVLNTSRLELGALTITPESIDLITAVKEQVRIMTLKAQAKNLKLVEIYPQPMLRTMMDPVLLQMVLQNLIANAIQYTLQGGIVTVTAERKDAQIILSVADTGLGIPLREQPYVFDKLYRAKNANSHTTQGTGLGLYFVKSIVTSAGGRVWFTSVEGEGTSFFVAFPHSGMTTGTRTSQLL